MNLSPEPAGGRSISRLSLGTAQLGLGYGIANRAGKPGLRAAIGIVEAAWEGSVTTFDTAAAYGDSEIVLGRALRELGLAGEAIVVTKVRPLTAAENCNPARAEAAILGSLEASRRRLGPIRPPIVLFHREADARHIEVLAREQERGAIGGIGLSFEGGAATTADLPDHPGLTAIQVPASLLDRRYHDQGIVPAAGSRGVAVFVRSVFLQGLLLMPEDEIPAGLRAVVPVRRRIEDLARRMGIGMAELAVRFMLGRSGVTSLVIGAESIAQVQENVRCVAGGPLPPEIDAEAAGFSANLPVAILNPARWDPHPCP